MSASLSSLCLTSLLAALRSGRDFPLPLLPTDLELDDLLRCRTLEEQARSLLSGDRVDRLTLLRPGFNPDLVRSLIWEAAFLDSLRCLKFLVGNFCRRRQLLDLFLWALSNSSSERQEIVRFLYSTVEFLLRVEDYNFRRAYKTALRRSLELDDPFPFSLLEEEGVDPFSALARNCRRLLSPLPERFDAMGAMALLEAARDGYGPVTEETVRSVERKEVALLARFLSLLLREGGREEREEALGRLEKKRAEEGIVALLWRMVSPRQTEILVRNVADLPLNFDAVFVGLLWRTPAERVAAREWSSLLREEKNRKRGEGLLRL